MLHCPQGVGRDLAWLSVERHMRSTMASSLVQNASQVQYLPLGTRADVIASVLDETADVCPPPGAPHTPLSAGTFDDARSSHRPSASTLKTHIDDQHDIHTF